MRELFQRLNVYRTRLSQPVFLLIGASLIFFLPIVADGQWAPDHPGWLLGVAAGVQRTSFADRQAGQVFFSGFSFSPVFDLRRTSPHAETQLELSGTSINARTDVQNNHNAAEHVVSIELHHVLYVGSVHQKLRPGAGLSVEGLYVSRRIPDLINTGRFTDVAVSMEALVGARWEFDGDGSGWVVSDWITGSLAGLYGYSPYSAQYQTGNTPASNKGALRFGGPDKWLRLVNTLTIGKKISRRSGLGLKYRWDYYRMNAEDISRQTSNRILLNYEFSF